MSDEELKKIIEETVGNNDPYWNEPAFNVVVLPELVFPVTRISPCG